MPENFFEPGRKSHCLFSPELWCDKFDPAAQFSPFEFLCDIETQSVGVVLPAPEGEAGEIWDRIYRTIEGVWQDRQIGFHCERSGPEAWTAERPCAACSLVRAAQVVVIDLQGRDARAAGFREMAAGSSNSLQILKAFGETPGKRVILINCGPIELPPFYQKLFDWIDYAGADGQPDLGKLAREMETIALSFFQAGEPILFDPEEFAEPSAAAAPPPGDDEDWLDNIKILGEIPVTAPAPLPRTPEERLAEALAKAEALVRKGQCAAAFQAVQEAGELRALDRAGKLRDLERECVSRMGAKDLADLYFRGLTGRDRSRFALSPWEGGRIAMARLTLQGTDLQTLLGAREVVLCACDQLEAEEADDLRRQLSARPAGERAALVVVGDCDEATCRQVAELRGEQVWDLHLSDLRRWVLERRPPFQSLQDRLRPDYRRQDDLFLCGLHGPVWAERDFFGRGELLTWMRDCLRSGDSSALYGLPRSGKSSLLWRLARQPDWAGHLVAVIDLAGPAAERPAEVYARTARALREAAAMRYPGKGAGALDLPKVGELFALPPSAPLEAFRGRFEVDVRALVAAIRRQVDPGFQRLVLLFDEMESILPGERRVLFGQLQSLTQDGSLAIGMAGLGFALRQELGDRGCPLRGVQTRVLTGLSEDECGRLISSLGHRMYRHFTEEAVAQIARESGGQPLLVRYLCSFILEAAPRGGETLGEEAVRPGVERALAAENLRRRLRWLFAEVEQQFPIGADLLREMALAPEALAAKGAGLPWLEGKSGLDRTTLDRHLGTLESYGLVDRSGDHSQHRISLLSRWLRKRWEIGS